MSCHTFSFAGCKYESPACKIYDVAVDSAVLVSSVDCSTINEYTDDPTSIDLFY